MKKVTQIKAAACEKAAKAIVSTKRMLKRTLIVSLAVTAVMAITVYSTIDIALPHTHNIYIAAKLVDGEARGESSKGQKAVFATVLQRMEDSGFPDTMHAVIFQTYTNNEKLLQYNAMGDTLHENLSTELGQTILLRTAWWYTLNQLGLFSAPSEAYKAHSYCVRSACERQSAYFGKLQEVGTIGNHVFFATQAASETASLGSVRPRIRPEGIIPSLESVPRPKMHPTDLVPAQDIAALIAQVIAEEKE
ncbi:MAG: hypothetical protein ACI9H6_000278 [Patiriisocius sp.]|jgi:hypothetical protein